MVESDRDSTRYCSSHGRRVPRPNEREHAHWLSQLKVWLLVAVVEGGCFGGEVVVVLVGVA
jgi:hypothetical protein